MFWSGQRMATRDLATNTQRALKQADGIVAFTSQELIKSYSKALKEIRVKLDSLYKKFLKLDEPTAAQLTQFMRLSKVEKNIVDIMKPYLKANEAFIKDMTVLGIDNGYFTNAWALDQASGLSLSWGMIDDTAVRAAAGIGGDIANLTGLLSGAEIKQHKQVLSDAFTNYDKDSIKWISRDIKQGILQGESAVNVARRLQKNGMAMSFNSAMRIARTETLRASGLSGQIAYEEARTFGVEVNEIWDATLDDRTRPDHVGADGNIRDNETGFFSVPWGQSLGPHRNGIAEQDISCRCISVGEVDGYSPELQAERDKGLQPRQTLKSWIKDQGLTKNRFGQKYNLDYLKEPTVSGVRIDISGLSG